MNLYEVDGVQFVAFKCPDCHHDDYIEFVSRKHVKCISCGWMFDFERAKVYRSNVN